MWIRERCHLKRPRIGQGGWGEWPRTKPDDGCHEGIPRPRAANGARVNQDELQWRVADTWDAFLRARQRHYTKVLGLAEPARPVLTKQIREAIVGALGEYDVELMADRELWREKSRVRAAGIGIFLSEHHMGQNDTGRSYMEPWRPWVKQRGKPDPVATFSDLYFIKKAGAK